MTVETSELFNNYKIFTVMKVKYVKNLILLIVFILLTFFPIGGDVNGNFKILFLTGLITLFFGLIFPHLAKYFSLRNQFRLEKPNWAEEINDKNPLTYIQYFGILAIVAGLGSLIGGILNGQLINFLGLMVLIFGIGIILGLYLLVFKLRKLETKTTNR